MKIPKEWTEVVNAWRTSDNTMNKIEKDEQWSTNHSTEYLTLSNTNLSKFRKILSFWSRYCLTFVCPFSIYGFWPLPLFLYLQTFLSSRMSINLYELFTIYCIPDISVIPLFLFFSILCQQYATIDNFTNTLYNIQNGLKDNWHWRNTVLLIH